MRVQDTQCLYKHNPVNHLEITNKMRPCIRIDYSNVSCCLTCFELHIAHHQELKNCICSLWFYIRLWLPDSVRQPQTCVKPEATNTVFWAPDDERCVARNMLSNKKRRNNKFSVRQPQTYVKPEAANTVFAAPDNERCVARNLFSNKKRRNNKFSVRQPQTYVKPEAANRVFWAPDDERCVARNLLSNKKRWNNKF